MHEPKKANRGEGEAKCTHCGLEVLDSTHYLWDCKCINQKRTKNHVSEAEALNLPQTVKMGIPPAMSADFSAPFWGKNLSDECASNEYDAQIIGQPFTSHETHIATLNNK